MESFNSNPKGENRLSGNRTIFPIDHIFFKLSPFVYESSIFITNILIITSQLTIILLLIQKINIVFFIKENTINNLTQIATSFSALSLAFPLFLKDFKMQKILWTTFLTLCILFTFTTILGMLILIFYPADSHTLEFNIIFSTIFIFVISTRSFVSIKRIEYINKNKDHFITNLLPSEKYDFIILSITIIFSIILNNNLTSSFFTLLFYSLIILITSILSTVFSNLKYNTSEQIKFEFKNRIHYYLEKEPLKAFSFSEILNLLREEYNEFISRNILTEIISEMDSEVNPNHPMATFIPDDYVIARWKNDYSTILQDKFNKIFFFKTENNDSNIDIEFCKNNENILKKNISNNSKIPGGFFRDIDIIQLFLKYIDKTGNVSLNDLNSELYFAFGYNHNTILKQKEKLKCAALTLKELKEIKKYINNNTYFPDNINDTIKEKLINEFFKQILLDGKEYNSFANNLYVRETTTKYYLMAINSKEYKPIKKSLQQRRNSGKKI